MAGKKDEVMCCFCGEWLARQRALSLAVRPVSDPEEVQELFCHREHLAKHMHGSIPLALSGED